MGQDYNRATNRIEARNLILSEMADAEEARIEGIRNCYDLSGLYRKIDLAIEDEIDRTLKENGIDSCKNCSVIKVMIEMGHSCRLYRYSKSHCEDSGLRIESEKIQGGETKIKIQKIGGEILREFNVGLY